MSTLSEERIATLLAPYLAPANRHRLDGALLGKLSSYLDLLVRWNQRTNLSAIREPEQIVQRHFGESLFAAQCLLERVGAAGRILDLGSGAGFPGLPMQLWEPGWSVTLAESQGKKAAFLREAVRQLEVCAEVWSNRAEALPPARRFEVVTMRAVDHMEEMLPVASSRAVPGGWLVLLTGEAEGDEVLPMPERRGSFVVFRRTG